MCNSLTSAIPLFYIIKLFSLSLQLDHQGRMPMFVLAPLLSLHLLTFYQIITFIVFLVYFSVRLLSGVGTRKPDIRLVSGGWISGGYPPSSGGSFS